jgi:hypothetical protein
MGKLFRAVLLPLLIVSPGCSGSIKQGGEPVDPQAIEVLVAHWEALQKRNWRTAYELIHPQIKTSGFDLKRFTSLHAKRSVSKGLPDKVRIAGSKQTGNVVVVDYDLIHRSPEGGEVVVPPRRQATLRKARESWRLITHDILALGLAPAVSNSSP